MEFFYREMRRSMGLLMDGAEPEGGRWNFDAENRKPAGNALRMAEVPRFEPDQITREVLDLVKNRFDNHFGDLEPFWFAVTREDAERAFAHFLNQALPHFGDYQDAMLAREKYLYTRWRRSTSISASSIRSTCAATPKRNIAQAAPL